MEVILYAWLIFTMIFTAASESGHSSLVSSSSSMDSATAEARGGERCRLPGRWEGSWFQSGVHQTITINSTSISTKGKCLENENDKFLVYNEKDNCYRCVVFHEKHLNVLQYKETFCIKDRRTLLNACKTITGDANLFSMFRLDGVPIDCPFKGPFTFNYNRGHGDCKYPVSTIDNCIHSSRQLFSFAACPDVRSESTVEELQCLGVWKEGSSRYLLGRFTYQHHASNEERFRCFAFEKSKKGGIFSSPAIVQVVHGSLGNNSATAALTSNNNKNGEDGLTQGQGQSGTSDILFRVAQSGDATCNGLTSMDGSRTMILRKAPPQPKCQFPFWVQVHAQWHTLDQRSTFTFDASTLKVSNSSDLAGMGPNTLTMTGSCHHVKETTLDRVVLALHVTSECKSGYMCSSIYKRDGHIVEMQMGGLARTADDACHISNFNLSQLPYITLVSSTPDTRQCPNLGQFAVTGLVRDGREVKDQCNEGFTTLRIGCSSLDTLQFRSSCSNADVIAGLFRAEYSCHGFWEESGVSYLITTPLSRASTGARRYCFVFKETLEPLQTKGKASSSRIISSSSEDHNPSSLSGEETGPEFKRILHFSSIADSCRRNVSPGIEGALAFNVTSHGRCDDISGAIIGLSFPWWYVPFFLTFSSAILLQTMQIRV